MRLLTHNTLRNQAADAKGKGFPLQIRSAHKIRVDDVPNADQQASDNDRKIRFVSNILPTLDWSALVQVRLDVSG
jgi:hypothetical protein